MVEYLSHNNIQNLINLKKYDYNEEIEATFTNQLAQMLLEESRQTLTFISTMVSISKVQNNHLAKEANEIISYLSKETSLYEKLWKAYKALCQEKVPEHLEKNPVSFFGAKISQEFWMLNTLYKAVELDLFVVGRDFFKDMFNTFYDQKFEGSLVFDANIFTAENIDEGYFDYTKKIKEVTALLIMASLKIRDLFRVDPKQLLCKSNSTFQLLTTGADEAMEKFTHMFQSQSAEFYKIGHAASALKCAIDALIILMERNTGDFGAEKTKLTDLLFRLDYEPDYKMGLKNLFDSSYYSFLTSTEKSLVRQTVKDFFILITVPKKDNSSTIEEFEDEEAAFCKKIFCHLLETSEEVESFWQNFNPSDIYRQDISVVFSNFLDIFPYRGELCLEIASDLVGSYSQMCVMDVVRIFGERESYLREGLGLGEIREGGWREIIEGEGGTMVLTEPLFINSSLPIEIPRGTKFIQTPCKNLKFDFKVNFWNVFWKSITAKVQEARTTDIDLSQMHQKFLILLCRIISATPLNIKYMQNVLLAESLDQISVNEDKEFGVIPLLLLSVLDFIKTSPYMVELIYEIVRALNCLLMAELNKETEIILQCFEHLKVRDNEMMEPHILSTVIEVLSHKVYDSKKINAALLNELVRFVEIIILKSEYIFEIFPCESIVAKKSHVLKKNGEDLLLHFKESYLNLSRDGYWMEDKASEFSQAIFNICQKQARGAMFIPTTLIQDILMKTFIPAIEFTTNNSLIDFDSHIDIKYQIKSRILSIFTNLFKRFKRCSGSQLVENSPDGAAPYISSQLIDFLNQLNFINYLFGALDIEVPDPSIFFGDRTAPFRSNELGIENKVFMGEIWLSKTKSKAQDSYQTYMVEVFKCFRVCLDLASDCIQDSLSHAAKLGFIRQFASLISTTDNFYGVPFTNFSQEYSINFFIMIMLLSNFNQEKRIRALEEQELYFFADVVERFCPQELFAAGTITFSGRGFGLKMDQANILTSGRNGEIPRHSSISAASLSTLTDVLIFWRNNNRSNKPILYDILTTGKLSTHFANSVVPWLNRNLLDHMVQIEYNSEECYQALRFLGECLVSQQTYFNDFLKYCSNLNQGCHVINELVQTFHKIVTFLESLQPEDVFEKDYYFECFCQIVQLISNLYIRPNTRTEIISQLKPTVLTSLSSLVERLVQRRPVLINNAIQASLDLFLSKNREFLYLNNVNAGKIIELIRIRFLLDQECNFCFSLNQFMKVLRMELIDKSKKAASSNGSSKTVKTNLFLTLMNYCIDHNKLKIPPFLEEMASIIDNKLLSVQIKRPFDDAISDNSSDLKFVHNNKVHFNQYKEPFYNSSWGNQYNELDTQTHLRETSSPVQNINTTLYYLSIFNMLNKTSLFNLMLIQEINFNIAYETSNGLEGALLSSTLHPNPLYAPEKFINNLYGLMKEAGVQVPNFEDHAKEIAKAASRMDGSAISPIEKRLYNPLYETKQNEWCGNMYGLKTSCKWDVSFFEQIVSCVLEEIGKITFLIDKVKSDFTKNSSEIFWDSPLFALVATMTKVAINHLIVLNHLMANMYYGLKAPHSNLTSEETSTLDKITQNLVKCVTQFIYTVNSKNSASAGTSSNKDKFTTILLANYYGLLVLTHDLETTQEWSTIKQYFQVANILSHLIKNDLNSLLLAIQSFNLLAEVAPNAVNQEDIKLLIDYLDQDELEEDCFKSICQFLICIVNNPRHNLSLTDLNIISSLTTIKKFKTCPKFIQFNCYNAEKLDNSFSLWLWTLNVVIHTFERQKTQQNSIHEVISFIKTYQQRIFSVLGFQFVGLSEFKSGFIRFEESRKTRNEAFRTNAFVEELDLTLTLVNIAFREIHRWIDKNPSLFESLFEILLTKTVFLMDTRQSINEVYLPISWLEKTSQSIKVLSSNTIRDIPNLELNQSRKSSIHPKMTTKKSSLISDYRPRTEDSISGGYNPDLFAFKIELHLNKIIFLLCTALMDGLSIFDMDRDLSKQETSFNHLAAFSQKGETLANRLRSDQMFWRYIPDQINNIQGVVLSTIHRLIAYEESYSRGIIRLAMFQNCSETCKQTHMISCIFPQYTLEELYKQSFASIEVTFMLLISLFQAFDSVDRSVKIESFDSLKKVRHDASEVLSNFERINRQKKSVISVASALGKTSIKKPREESLFKGQDEDTKSKRFVTFIRNYFNDNY